MNKVTLTPIFSLIVFFVCAFTTSNFAQKNTYNPRHLIVKLNTKVTALEQTSWKKELGARTLKRTQNGFELWELPEFPLTTKRTDEKSKPKTYRTILELLSDDDPKAEVDGSGLNYILDTPASLGDILEHLNLEQYNPAPHCRDLALNVPLAKAPNVPRIGIIDSGIDEATISSLFPNVTISNNGQYNYISPGQPAVDSAGHGTQIAGIIAGTLMSWQVPQAEIIPFKVMDANGQGSIFDLLMAIDDATSEGVHVLNMSLGFTPAPNDPNTTALFQAALDAAGAAGTLSLTAAGNSGNDNDAQPYYPASLSAINKITVAASECGAGLAAFSNYGATTVDFAAPGTDIICPTLGGYWVYSSGTSFSTAIVSGMAAALSSSMATVDMSAVYCALKSGVMPTPALTPFTMDDGVVNGPNALAMLSSGCSPFFNTTVFNSSVTQPVSSAVVTFYPNPVVESANIAFQCETHEVDITVLDANGRMLKQYLFPTTEGYNQLQLNLKDLSSGTYYIFSNKLSTATQFVKQ